eukprot:2878776-Prymnesium_polylepis.1
MSDAACAETPSDGGFRELPPALRSDGTASGGICSDGICSDGTASGGISSDGVELTPATPAGAATQRAAA